MRPYLPRTATTILVACFLLFLPGGRTFRIDPSSSTRSKGGDALAAAEADLSRKAAAALDSIDKEASSVAEDPGAPPPPSSSLRSSQTPTASPTPAEKQRRRDDGMNGTAATQAPAQGHQWHLDDVFFVVLFILAISIGFEVLRESTQAQVRHNVVLAPIATQMFAEMTVLGFVSIVMTVLEDSGGIAALENVLSKSKDHSRARLSHVFESVHMLLFGLICLFMFFILILVVHLGKKSDVWEEWEESFCPHLEPTETHKRLLDAQVDEVRAAMAEVERRGEPGYVDCICGRGETRVYSQELRAVIRYLSLRNGFLDRRDNIVDAPAVPMPVAPEDVTDRFHFGAYLVCCLANATSEVIVISNGTWVCMLVLFLILGLAELSTPRPPHLATGSGMAHEHQFVSVRGSAMLEHGPGTGGASSMLRDHPNMWAAAVGITWVLALLAKAIGDDLRHAVFMLSPHELYMRAARKSALFQGRLDEALAKAAVTGASLEHFKACNGRLPPYLFYEPVRHRAVFCGHRFGCARTTTDRFDAIWRFGGTTPKYMVLATRVILFYSAFIVALTVRATGDDLSERKWDVLWLPVLVFPAVVYMLVKCCSNLEDLVVALSVESRRHMPTVNKVVHMEIETRTVGILKILLGVHRLRMVTRLPKGGQENEIVRYAALFRRVAGADAAASLTESGGQQPDHDEVGNLMMAERIGVRPISSEDREFLERAFRLADKDENGMMDAAELKSLMRTLGVDDMADETVAEVAGAMDATGFVSRHEFMFFMEGLLALLFHNAVQEQSRTTRRFSSDRSIHKDFFGADRKKKKQDQLAKDLFNMVDLNHDGFVSRAELIKVLTQFDVVGLTEHEIMGAIEDIDIDGDGRIDVREFVTMLTAVEIQRARWQIGDTKQLVQLPGQVIRKSLLVRCFGPCCCCWQEQRRDSIARRESKAKAGTKARRKSELERRAELRRAAEAAASPAPPPPTGAAQQLGPFMSGVKDDPLTAKGHSDALTLYEALHSSKAAAVDAQPAAEDGAAGQATMSTMTFDPLVDNSDAQQDANTMTEPSSEVRLPHGRNSLQRSGSLDIFGDLTD